jgi:hypothetical protein
MGAGTVKMGRYVVALMGGLVSERAESRLLCGEEEVCFSEEEEVLLELLVAEETLFDFGRVFVGDFVVDEVLAPAMMGGGNSNPSWVFRESCRAKSELCHHSRNLSAKIDVGRSNLKLDKSWGYSTLARILGFSREITPGLAPSVPLDGEGGGFVANSIAFASAAFNLLILVPMSIINGE